MTMFATMSFSAANFAIQRIRYLQKRWNRFVAEFSSCSDLDVSTLLPILLRPSLSPNRKRVNVTRNLYSADSVGRPARRAQHSFEYS